MAKRPRIRSVILNRVPGFERRPINELEPGAYNTRTVNVIEDALTGDIIIQFEVLEKAE